MKDKLNKKITSLHILKKYIEKEEDKILKILYKKTKYFKYDLIIHKIIHKNDRIRQLYKTTDLKSIINDKLININQLISFKNITVKESIVWVKLSDNSGWIIYD